MKRAFVVVIAVALLLGSVRPVSAHVLKTSGSVGAVMHINPDDDPVARESSNFLFEFKDKENKFRPSDCNCTVSVIESGKEIFSDTLTFNESKNDLTTANFAFVFPQRDVYQVRITANPKSKGNFPPFVLEYDVRVEREKTTAAPPAEPKPSSFVNAYVFFSGLIVVVLITLIIKIARGKR